MAKYFGRIGYSVTEETAPGVYLPTERERPYYGDILRNGSRWQSNTNSTNDNIVANVTISILADAYAYENFSHITYAEYMGALWKISSAEVQAPRILLTLGEVYTNVQQA